MDQRPENESKAGLILLSPGGPSDVLVGMEFLKTFNKVLLVHPDQRLTALVDVKDVNDFLDALKVLVEEAQKAKAPQPALPKPTEEPKPPESAATVGDSNSK
jgi:hypothetical protein